jgi:hypothetical protein
LATPAPERSSLPPITDDTESARSKLTSQIDKEKSSSLDRNITIAIIAALIGFLGNLGVSYLNNKAAVDLEREKLKSALITDAVKDGDVDKSKERLRFLLQIKLIEDKGGLISAIVDQNLAPAILPGSSFADVFRYPYPGPTGKECFGYFLKRMSGDWVEYTRGDNGCLATTYYFQPLKDDAVHIVLQDLSRPYFLRLPTQGNGLAELATSEQGPWSSIHPVTRINTK